MSPNDLSLLLGLVLAHLIGDFVLQPRRWVEERIRRQHRSRHLLHHVGVHACLTAVVLLVAFRLMPGAPGLLAAFAGAAGVAISHWLIDLVKAKLPGKLRWFLLDQALHLLVLAAVWLIWLGSTAPLAMLLEWLVAAQTLGLIVAYLLITRPVSIMIGLVMRRWSQQLETPGTLAEAGARIGMLERFLVLTLVLLDQLTAVGFLLAAKSVLRFGDLKSAQDRKLTEYVLLGTLLSVASTLALGLLLRLLMTGPV
ncbi:Protein of unknown function [Franzmannia pantelleriensis]|uniref:DUF3307 domain-containing protein n=1 Tax=Franzmannia pantelleriensis TaxID=48727 RepID=A0A1G9UGR6_9GAMM|nr:DUF3307 domain-containing protein [Halomonas pantelleriensis]SDM59101.1 Protein of unknown function [Halomonas pantelleriensis]